MKPWKLACGLMVCACAGAARGESWAVGSGGVIMHTAGPGSPWELQASGTTNAINAISFTDANNGWAVGSSVVLHTTNGGATWVSQSIGVTTNLKAVSFSDPLHGWVAGGVPNLVYRTVDGGATWTNVPVPITPPAVSSTVSGLFFLTGDHGWIEDTVDLQETTDGGAHWTERTTGSFLTGLDVVDGSHLWSGPLSGGVMHSEDAGLTWQTSSVGGTLYGNSFGDPLHGWLVSTVATIRVTADGGNTWNFANTGAPFGLTQLMMADGGHGWAFDSHGDIRYSADGGTTWTGIASPISSAITGTFNLAPEPGSGVLMLGAVLGLLKRRRGSAAQKRDYKYCVLRT